MPQHAPSVVYQMLILIGFPKPLLRGLQPFVNMKIQLEQNQLMDLTLTLSFVWEKSQKKNIKNLKN